jgi:hypothetical protein
MLKEIAAVAGLGFASYVAVDKWQSGTWFWEKPPFTTARTQQMQQAHLNALVAQRVAQEVQRRENQRKQAMITTGKYAPNSHSQSGYSVNRWSQRNPSVY